MTKEAKQASKTTAKPRKATAKPLRPDATMLFVEMAAEVVEHLEAVGRSVEASIRALTCATCTIIQMHGVSELTANEVRAIRAGRARAAGEPPTSRELEGKFPTKVGQIQAVAGGLADPAQDEGNIVSLLGFLAKE